ncbi:glycerophosphodiester phosphodiesterase [Vibrio viridaestus]|uniref:Glycerophosphodiester phosphodiesterase n=1 Tax=Vibrio viridaestus TaxID=2487322 RepID=A0A3N9TJF5_9VIBR|nr:glycerophosphodiester phosphodiesterase [Vibrio viridaestus]RQW64387.1 glycerophosphodiester phosphodiesterase [Vibrio viridaestus]
MINILNKKLRLYSLRISALIIISFAVNNVASAAIPNPAIIAHRGDSYNAPESTLPAYQLACKLNADYLELDLQRTKDGQLIALHDNNLQRTTNIKDVYPERASEPVSSFTLAELEKLDAGSWFNNTYPERARKSFAGLKVVTLKQVSDIAKSCPGHPGLYIETKVPKLFPDIEKDLHQFLESNGWLEHPEDGKIILQTFEKPSLVELQKVMPNVPKILLLWTGDGYIDEKPGTKKADSESYADYYARVDVASKKAFEEWLDFAKENGAIGVGPSTIQDDHAGTFSSQFSYMDLAKPWMVKMSHDKGLLVHAYTVDQISDFSTLRERGVDGFFTNRPDLAAKFFKRSVSRSPEQMLDELNYSK